MATKQEPIRRTDVVRCETCGEDYSITYKRCPFCDERPGRSPRAGMGAGGRRVSGGANPLQVFILLLTVALIIAALFIVFTTVAPLLSRKEPSSSTQQPSVSQPAVSQPDASTPGSIGDISVVPNPDVSTEQPGTDTPAVNPGTDTPADPVVVTKVNSLSLNKTDFTFSSLNEPAVQMKVNGTSSTPTWSIGNTSVATISSDGKVRPVGNGTTNVTCTVDGQTLKCIVRVNLR